MRFITLILVTLCFQACNSQTTKIEGNRNVTKTQKKAGNYSQIFSTGFIDVVLTEGTVGDITIEAESNLVDYIEVENKGEVLTIGTKRNLNLRTTKGIIVYVPVDKITRIKSSGSGNILAKKDLISTDLSLELSGSGDAILKKVKATTFSVKSGGSGDVILQGLDVVTADISIRGSSDIKISSVNSEITNAAISGSGGLLLAGKTKGFNVKISGSADVKVDNLIADNVDLSISGSGDIICYANKTISVAISGSGNVFYKGNGAITNVRSSGSGKIKKL